MPYFYFDEATKISRAPQNWCDKFYNLGFDKVSAKRHIIIAIFFLLLVVLDYFTFYNFPLEKALVLERK